MSTLKRMIEDEEDDIWDYKSSRKIKSSRDGSTKIFDSSIIARDRVCKQTSSRKNVAKKASNFQREERLEMKRSKLLQKRNPIKAVPSSDCTVHMPPSSPVTNDLVVTPIKTSCSQPASQIKVPSTPRSWERPPVPGCCPHCQVPFQALTTDSPRWHAMECMDQPFIATQECPFGLLCDDTIPGHYRRYRHTLLAKHRAGIQSSSDQNSPAKTCADLSGASTCIVASSASSFSARCPESRNDKLTSSPSRWKVTSATVSTEKSPYFGKSCDASNKGIKSVTRMLFASSQSPRKDGTEKEVDAGNDLSQMSETGSDQDIFESLSNSPNKPIIENSKKNEEDVVSVQDVTLDINFASSLTRRLTYRQNETLAKSEYGDSSVMAVKLESNEGYDDVIVLGSNSAEEALSDEGSTEEFVKDVSDMLSEVFDYPAGHGNEDHDVKPSPSLTPLSLDWVDAEHGNEDHDIKPSPSLTPLSLDSVDADSAEPQHFYDVPSPCRTPLSLHSEGAVVSSPDIDEEELVKNMKGIKSDELSDGEDDLGAMNDHDLVELADHAESQALCDDDKNNNNASSASVAVVNKIDPSKYSYQPRTNKNSRAPRKPALKQPVQQNSILSFFSVKGNGTAVKPNSPQVNGSASSVTQIVSAPTAGPSLGVGALGNGRPATYAGKKQFNRKCPFYKKIPGTPFTVDAFNYGSIPGCTAYFLTHFHYDHYGGLKKSFAHPIYLTQITANLVTKRIKTASHYLHPIALDTPTVVQGVEVTFLEANHCPGAVLILFKLANRTVHLHTGDFRAHRCMESYPALQGISIDTLYLDTTYCDPSHAFPPQEAVMRWAVETVEEFLRTHPNGFVAVGSYTIGKERIFRAISEAIGSKVCVTREKLGILECLDDAALTASLTLGQKEARVHVMPMGHLKYEKLQEYLSKLRGRFDSVLAIEPTGWTHQKSCTDLRQLKPKYKRENVIIYGVPYSEHSSFTEMKRFVQVMRPKTILPTVNNANPASRRKMENLFVSWLKEAEQGIASPMKQSSLVGWFKSFMK